MKMSKKERTYCYEYPHPAVTVDAVVLGKDRGELKVLLIQRKGAPFRGRWAIPGGFVEMNESLEEAARRELEEETGLSGLEFEQVGAFGEPKRDPRERVISVAYVAVVKLAGLNVRAADDAKKAEWFPVGDLPALAFDHAKIIEVALKRMRSRARRRR